LKVYAVHIFVKVTVMSATWETSKENVQPIRSGRNVACLQAALQVSLHIVIVKPCKWLCMQIWISWVIT